MIAKISHAVTVALIGYDAFTPYLTGIIRGTDRRYYHFIGSHSVQEPDTKGLHGFSVFCGIPHMSLIGQPTDTEHVCVSVRLFCRYAMPEYLSIVGKLKGAFKIIAPLD